jgi:hypothetical protein
MPARRAMRSGLAQISTRATQYLQPFEVLGRKFGYNKRQVECKKGVGATIFQSHPRHSSISGDSFKKSSSHYTKESPKSGERISHIPAIETKTR